MNSRDWLNFDILIIMEIYIYSIRAIFCPFFVQDKGWIWTQDRNSDQ